MVFLDCRVTSRHVYFAKNDIISCNKTAMAGQARLKALTAFRKEKKNIHTNHTYSSATPVQVLHVLSTFTHNKIIDI